MATTTPTSSDTRDDDTRSLDTTGYNADELGQYRSLSTLAVIAFVLGLCSAAMFAGPLMVVVPLAAVAAALLALKGIASSEGGVSGAWLARWGLALAIFFSVASAAHIKVRDNLLQRQADDVGRQWLSLAAEGRSEEMLELMTEVAIDKVAPASGAGQMSVFGSIFSSALLRQDPLVVKLNDLQEVVAASFRLTDASVSIKSRPPQAVFRYTASCPGQEQQLCLLVLKRYRNADLNVIWLVDSWTLE